MWATVAVSVGLGTTVGVATLRRAESAAPDAAVMRRNEPAEAARSPAAAARARARADTDDVVESARSEPRGKWREVYLRALASRGRLVVGSDSPDDERLVVELADPGAFRDALSEARYLAAAEDARGLATLLAALGRVPSVDLQLELLRASESWSESGRNLAFAAAALARGHRDRAPSGMMTLTAVGEAGEIAEPSIRRYLRQAVDDAIRGGDDPALLTNAMVALAASSHIDPDLDAWLAELARREDRFGGFARSSLLTSGRTPLAVSTAVAIVRSPSASVQDAQNAVMALGRAKLTGPQWDDIVAGLTADGPQTRRVGLVQGLPWLVDSSVDRAWTGVAVLDVLARLCRDDSRDVRSAAVVAASTVVLRLGGDWGRMPVEPDRVLRDATITAEARAVVSKRWSATFDEGDAPSRWQDVLSDTSLSADLRQRFWHDLREAATTRDRRVTLSQIAGQVAAIEPDQDIQTLLNELRRGN